MAVENNENKHILYLARHGESKCNVTKKILPASEDALTDAGIEQAILLGKYLSDEKFTNAISSDYIRAYDTARNILSQSKLEAVRNLEITQDPRIHERWLGIYENGEMRDVLKVLAEKVIKEKVCPTELDLPEADSPEKMFKNVEGFLSDIFKIIDATSDDEPPRRILAVSHGYTMLFFAYHISRSSGKYNPININETLHKLSPNTGFIKMAIEKCPKANKPRNIEFMKIHEIEHLKSMQKEDVLHVYTKSSSDAKQFQGCIHQ